MVPVEKSNFAYGVFFVLFVLFGVQSTTIGKNSGKDLIVCDLVNPDSLPSLVSTQNLIFEAASFEAVVPSLNSFSFHSKDKQIDPAISQFTSFSSLNPIKLISYRIPNIKVWIASGILECLYPYFFFF